MYVTEFSDVVFALWLVSLMFGQSYVWSVLCLVSLMFGQSYVWPVLCLVSLGCLVKHPLGRLQPETLAFLVGVRLELRIESGLELRVGLELIVVLGLW